MSVNYTEAASKSVDVGGVPFVYRELGPAAGVPLLFLNHITAVLDDWDPAVVDGFAAERHVVLVDLRGVGGSGGTTPDDIEAMAADAVAFVEALGLGTVDLLGFSLGGMVAQEFMRQRPDLARRVILTATSPAGDEGVADWGAKLQAASRRPTRRASTRSTRCSSRPPRRARPPQRHSWLGSTGVARIVTPLCRRRRSVRNSLLPPGGNGSPRPRDFRS